LVYEQLATDLRSDRFQQYLLDDTFCKLVGGASARLLQLNERYELAYSDGQFAVLDHDHGRQPRLADTLSGGETFLVSLALALELSNQIQEATGAVRLDSLFIDEGFGTLDPETLDTVAEAIETLGKSNRLVGIITHVPELHRRLPRLQVTPGPEGSRVEFVED
jgi:exonuclease SbcC